MAIEQLLLVPGHATFSDKVKAIGQVDINDENNWVLLPYQRGEVPCYLEHIEWGLEELRIRNNAVLTFAGGVSRTESHWSEADSYKVCAQIICNEFGWDFEELKPRINLETRSTDSIQNLLQSILGFKDLYGTLPKMVTVGGWGFKKERFEEIARIIKWPLGKFAYVEVNCPQNIKEVVELEQESLKRLILSPTGAQPLLMGGRVWSGPIQSKLQINYAG
jgi:hypothetical protein